jgi:hypothetical protein
MTDKGETPRSWRNGAIAVAVVSAIVLIVALAVDGSHGRTRAWQQAQTTAPSRCNGAARLCDRPLDEVVFAGTHNSYAASDEPGWRFANQRFGIARQLDDGIRALLIDVHFGINDKAKGLVRTDLRAEGSDRNKVAQVIPNRALALADRLAGRVGVGALNGTPELYLCHTLCELGSEPLDQELEVIARFLQGHHDQVLIVIVEDYVPPQAIERAFERTGLLSYVATLERRAPMLTLGALIARGQRLLVFAEEAGGSPPWYMRAFSFIQDTPLGARRPSQLSCARARGEQDSPLLLINNWIETFPPLPALNAPIGHAETLRRRIAKCEAERGIPGAIVAGDFYEQSDLVKVAEQLNQEPAGAR